MYVVIFKATIARLDDEYFRIAENLKKSAFNNYGCLDFISLTVGNEEIAISYWETRQQILDWKEDSDHKIAQKNGLGKWYKSYSVDVCEVTRSYNGKL